MSLFADMIAGSMLLVSGANVPLDQLPEWIQALSSVIPVTHGIEAARELAAGASLADVAGLLAESWRSGASSSSSGSSCSVSSSGTAAAPHRSRRTELGWSSGDPLTPIGGRHDAGALALGQRWG